jgi:hypothetical protein
VQPVDTAQMSAGPKVGGGAAFMETLNLNTIIYLDAEDPSPFFQSFVEDHGIELVRASAPVSPVRTTCAVPPICAAEVRQEGARWVDVRCTSGGRLWEHRAAGSQ